MSKEHTINISEIAGIRAELVILMLECDKHKEKASPYDVERFEKIGNTLKDIIEKLNKFFCPKEQYVNAITGDTY